MGQNQPASIEQPPRLARRRRRWSTSRQTPPEPAAAPAAGEATGLVPIVTTPDVPGSGMPSSMPAEPEVAPSAGDRSPRGPQRSTMRPTGHHPRPGRQVVPVTARRKTSSSRTTPSPPGIPTHQTPGRMIHGPPVPAPLTALAAQTPIWSPPARIPVTIRAMPQVTTPTSASGTPMVAMTTSRSRSSCSMTAWPWSCPATC